jgi:hypothetical protein
MCWMEILLVSSMFTIFDSKCIIPLQLSYFSLFFIAEAIQRILINFLDARLKAGFEERDRAIVAVESTLTSFLEILQNQEEQEEELELMFTERGHPLVPARAFTPGPIPTPPPQKDFKRKTRKKQRRFGPQIFQKPKPVILGISQGKSASSAGVCLLVC